MTETIYSDQSRKNGLQLISASERGDVETVKSLLKKDVYIHAQNGEGKCAIVAAAYNNHLEIVDLLITAGAKKYFFGGKGEAITSAILTPPIIISLLLRPQFI